MKIINVDIYIFVVIFIIFTIITVAYIVVKPDKSYMNNWSPFPDVYPQGIPSPNANINIKCKNTLMKCTTNIQCSAECGDVFECTPVGENEEVIYNGIKVPPGTWCLPAGKETGCGTYTGRSVWSYDPLEGQKWECVCLYPGLFGGERCMDPVACRDTTPEILGADQSKNVLVGTKEGGQAGKVWDPNLQDFFPPGGLSPYALDSKGNPVFTCACKSGEGKPTEVKFVSLPNDPYYCHAEPCGIHHEADVSGPKQAFGGDPKLPWECDCSKMQKGTFAKSNVKGPKYGTCNPAECGDIGHWDDATQKCTGCVTAGIDVPPVLCNSNLFERKGVELQCPDNAGGSYCPILCHPNLCQLPYSECTVSKGGDYSCSCPTGFSGIPLGNNSNVCEKGCTDGSVTLCGKHCENACVGITPGKAEHDTIVKKGYPCTQGCIQKVYPHKNYYRAGEGKPPLGVKVITPAGWCKNINIKAPPKMSCCGPCCNCGSKNCEFVKCDKYWT